MRKTPAPKDNLTAKKLKDSINVLRALSHPLRMEIMQFIDQGKTVNVNRIYAALKLEQSITSQHLRVLRMAGLVTTEREGKYIHYSIDYDRVSDATQAVGEFFDGKKDNPNG